MKTYRTNKFDHKLSRFIANRLVLRKRSRLAPIVITDNPILIGTGRVDAARRHRESFGRIAAEALLSPFETLDSVRQSLSKKPPGFVRDSRDEFRRRSA